MAMREAGSGRADARRESTNRPAGTAASPARLAATQSRAATGSIVSVAAVSAPTACATTVCSVFRVRLLAKKHLDQPSAVLILEHGERAFVGIEQFGQDARDRLRVRLRAEARDETIVHGSWRLRKLEGRGGFATNDAPGTTRIGEQGETSNADERLLIAVGWVSGPDFGPRNPPAASMSEKAVGYGLRPNPPYERKIYCA